MAAVKIQHKNCLWSTPRKKIINTLFAGLGRAILGKTVHSVLSTYTRPLAQFFPIRTSRPANNIYILCDQPCRETMILIHFLLALLIFVYSMVKFFKLGKHAQEKVNHCTEKKRSHSSNREFGCLCLKPFSPLSGRFRDPYGRLRSLLCIWKRWQSCSQVLSFAY